MQLSAVPNRGGVDRVWLCFPERTHESTQEYTYLKALDLASPGLTWDLFLVLHSEMCM